VILGVTSGLIKFKSGLALSYTFVLVLCMRNVDVMIKNSVSLKPNCNSQMRFTSRINLKFLQLKKTVCVISILTFFYSNSFSQTSGACEVIPNPGFEGGASGWDLSSGLSVVTTSPHSGNNAGRLGPGNGVWLQIPISPNTTYRLSFYVRNTAAPAWSVSNYSLLNASYSNVGSGVLFNNSTSLPGWVYREVTFTTPATGAFLGLWTQNGGPGDMFIDDFCLDPQVAYVPPPIGNLVTITNTSVYCPGNALIFNPITYQYDNLVVNPSFSSGNTGFTSGFASNATNACGNYTVAANASAYGWSSCGDHTTGAGNMMLVNPSATSNTNAWQQTVTVQANSSYKFSFWIASPSSSYLDPASVAMLINGTSIVGTILAPYQECNWLKVEGVWSSGTSTSATLAISNVVGTCTNRDFMLDDISFSKVAVVDGTYSWAGPSSFSSTLKQPMLTSLTASNAGTYTVTFTPNGGGSTSTDTHVISLASPCLDCDGPAQIVPTNPTSCATSNGSIFFTSYNEVPGKFEASIDGINWINQEQSFLGLATGDYWIQIRRKDNLQHCRTVKITLTYTDNSLFTSVTLNPATSCTIGNGSITLENLVQGTEVAWISGITQTFVPSSTLQSSGTRIQNLLPGRYYVTVRNPAAPYCLKEAIVDLPATSGACNATALCSSTLGINRFPNGTFGAGASNQGPPLTPTETEYGYVNMTCRAPDDGLYSIVSQTDCNTSNAVPDSIFGGWSVLTEDHTPGDVNGYMMLVNASFAPDIVFEKQINGLCPNTQYEFSLWVRMVNPPTQILTNLTFLVNGIGQYTTGPLSATTWQNVGFTFFTGSGTTARFSVRNNAPGGNGNDWIIDDIFVGVCEPIFVVNPAVILCASTGGATVQTTVTDPNNQFNRYVWQRSTDGGASWVSLTFPATATFSGSPSSYTATYTIPGPITSAQNGHLYRLLAATTVLNLASSNCIADAPPVLLDIPVVNINLSLSNYDACVGGTVPMTINATSTNPLTYQWQQSPNGSTGWTNISGATSNPYGVVTSATGTQYYRVVATDSKGCTATSGNSTLTTVADPTISISVDQGQVCVGGSAAFTATPVGGLGTCTLQWQSRIGAGPWANISGANATTYSVTNISANADYRAVYSCTAPGCCN
jgi:hypothetical protein